MLLLSAYVTAIHTIGDRLVQRLHSAIFTVPDGRGIVVGLLLLGVLVAVAIPLGFQTGFLRFDARLAPRQILKVLMTSLVFPAIAEELVFRAMLIPTPLEAVSTTTRLVWAGLSLVIFILYHPLNAATCFRRGSPTFMQPTFLALAAVLGGLCTLSYLQSGSIWPAILIHWLAVCVWLSFLGGHARLLE